MLGPRKTVRVTGSAASSPARPCGWCSRPRSRSTAPPSSSTGSALELGPAKLDGRLQLGAAKVAGELTLATLPLASLERFGAPALAGTGQAKLALTGTRAAPEVTLTASVAKAALDRAGKVKLDGRLDGTLRAGTLAADLSLTGLGKSPLTAQASLPVAFALDPPALALSDRAGLSGRIAGPIDLARAAQFAALDGLQLAGTLQSALDVSGTLQQPGLAGTLTLEGGSVQDVASGVILRKVGPARPCRRRPAHHRAADGHRSDGWEAGRQGCGAAPGRRRARL